MNYQKFLALTVVWKQVIKGSSVPVFFFFYMLIPSGAYWIYSLTSFKIVLFGLVPFIKASKQLIIHINVPIYWPIWRSSAASRLYFKSKHSRMWAMQSLLTVPDRSGAKWHIVSSKSLGFKDTEALACSLELLFSVIINIGNNSYGSNRLNC